METHLKDREYYEDRYDRATVKDCRRVEKIFLDAHKEKKNKKEAAKTAALFNYAWELKKIFLTKRWYDDKEPTITKWMEQDKKRDSLLAKAEAPRNVLCDECYDRMHEDGRTIYERDDKEEVLFFMRCPNEHLPLKGVFEDGTERKREPILCPECKSEMSVERLPKKGKGLKTKYTCASCGHEEIYDWNFSDEEENDPDYAKDRARFCLAGEELKKVQETVWQMEKMKSFVEDMRKRDEHKEEYDAVAKLEKLTIPQVKERVTEALKYTPYMNLTFEKPVIERFVAMEFSVEEMETDNQRASSSKLQKMVKQTLEGTNWRLMTGGIDYRLGLMTGRIRAYESEEDLLRLVS